MVRGILVVARNRAAGNGMVHEGPQEGATLCGLGVAVWADVDLFGLRWREFDTAAAPPARGCDANRRLFSECDGNQFGKYSVINHNRRLYGERRRIECKIIKKGEVKCFEFICLRAVRQCWFFRTLERNRG